MGVLLRDEIFDELCVERKYQEKKWGIDFDDKNTANDWSAYITRYNENASFAVTPQDWRRQMVKVACLAVAALEAFDKNGGLPNRHYD